MPEPGPGLAAPAAPGAVPGEPLSPPHSPERGKNNINTFNNNNLSDSDRDKPMDLSSGGLNQLLGYADMPMGLGGQPLLTSSRLLDLLRHQREQESQRKLEAEASTVTLSADNPGEGLRCAEDRVSPGVSGPGSPGSSSGSESGGAAGPAREKKKHRLNMLINKKFDKVASVLDNPSILMSTPPPSVRETSPASDSDRRPSTETTGGSTAAPLPAGDRKNRRKQSQPGSRPGTPPSISIRPNSDLFPPQPLETSTPRGHKEEDRGQARDYSPARKMSRSQSPPAPVATKLFTDEKENKDAIKNQILNQVMKNLGNTP